jgi:serine/threonine protein kinase
MGAPRPDRAFSSLGPALRLLGLALLVAAAQSAHDLWSGLAGIVRGNVAPALPGFADVFCGLAAVAVGVFYLRQADDNAQALAGGGQVLPPLTLRRLLQPRFEHPLRELWTRSDPATPAVPMPASRSFGVLWAAGLALAIPLWAFALIAPFSGRLAMALDAAHHLAIGGACIAALHFAVLLARRQDEAWHQVKPSVVTVPVRVVGKRPQQPALPAGRLLPAVSKPLAAAQPEPAPPKIPVPLKGAAPLAKSAPPPPPSEARVAAAAVPTQCPLCHAKIAGRRCDACGGPVLAASFRIVKALGGTGARRTFLAEGPDGARVVLKELSIATVPDAQSLEAFSREAKMLRELRHPKLPVYVDAFQEEEGPRARLYLAYRYLDGISLQKEMEDRPYNEEEVLDMVESVLEILRHLHGLQPPLIHRDLKPANLVRRRDGAIAVIDFGVARNLERTLNSGTMVGTVGYMPPEQLAGQVDLTSDLYALGATALHLLTRTAPWEFMDGPELRLPPLKSAPVARALLKRMVAPRRAQRFASAREALVALRRLREGKSRRPRTALAAAGVAAATVLAAGLGAERRIAAPPAPPVHASPKPAPPQTTPKPLPAPAPPDGLVNWRGGSLTAEQVKESLRRLPPWLKNDQPWWIQQHVLALVKRKLLEAEAEKRGLGAGLLAGEDRERGLVLALLASELHGDPDWVRERALRGSWTRLGTQLLAAANVSFDEARLFQIVPKKLFGALPGEAPAGEQTARLDFMAASGRCTLLLEPALRRYGGRCEGAATLAQALLDPDTLQLVDLSSLAHDFYTRYTDDFVEAKQLARAEGLEAAEQADRALEHAEMRVGAVTGSISFAQVQSLLSSVEPALRRCLAVGLQEAPDRALQARIRISIELRDGDVSSARIETNPKLAAPGCTQALARPEVAGTGSFEVVADLARAPGMPGRAAPPAPPPSRAAPARHWAPPAEDEGD